MLKRIIVAVIIGLIVAVIILLAFPSLRSMPSEHRLKLPLSETPISYHDAVRRAAPAVVNIYNRADNNTSPVPLNINTLGSGVIMSSKGYIITNKHVIDGAKQIIVTLQNGQTYDAILVGSDELTDLAVIKINAQELLPVIPINPSRQPQVGDVVLAIGNPYNIGQTVTQGIISATGRIGLSQYGRQNFIQTDASINQGNSGGALVNSLGELVGINTLTFAKILNGQVPEGIGFAIPTELATKIMEKLIRDGRVIRGYIGIDGVEFPPFYNRQNNGETVHGILVTHSSGPAATAGIEAKDILIAINNETISSIVDTMDKIAELPPNTVIQVTLLRNGKKLTLPVTISEL